MKWNSSPPRGHAITSQLQMASCRVLMVPLSQWQGAAVALSEDQTADREDERQRIISAGGHVKTSFGSWRVGKAGIQVSRCAAPAEAQMLHMTMPSLLKRNIRRPESEAAASCSVGQAPERAVAVFPAAE